MLSIPISLYQSLDLSKTKIMWLAIHNDVILHMWMENKDP
jgi:hypothetical protein